MDENQVSYEVIGAALKVHRFFGPGLLESIYESGLKMELLNSGFDVQSQVGFPVEYNGHDLGIGFRCDLLVDGKVIIEVKSVDAIANVHYSQLLSYLKLTNLKLGLLINFNVPYLKDGIKRVANNL